MSQPVELVRLWPHRPDWAAEGHLFVTIALPLMIGALVLGALGRILPDGVALAAVFLFAFSADAAAKFLRSLLTSLTIKPAAIVVRRGLRLRRVNREEVETVEGLRVGKWPFTAGYLVLGGTPVVLVPCSARWMEQDGRQLAGILRLPWKSRNTTAAEFRHGHR